MFSFDLRKVISMFIWEVGLCLLHFLQINPNQSIKIWLLVILEFQREKKIVMEICFCCQIWQDFRIMWFISDQSKKITPITKYWSRVTFKEIYQCAMLLLIKEIKQSGKWSCNIFFFCSWISRVDLPKTSWFVKLCHHVCIGTQRQ